MSPLNFVQYSHSLNTCTHTHKCNRTVALHAFYNQVIPGPVKIAMIGSGCSVATEPTAENSPYYNITQVSLSVVIFFLSNTK